MNENNSIPATDIAEELPIRLVTDFVCDVLKRPDGTTDSCAYCLDGNVVDHSEAAVSMASKIAEIIGQSDELPAGLYRFEHHQHHTELGEQIHGGSTSIEKLTALSSIDVTGFQDPDTGDDLFGLMGFGNYEGDNAEYAEKFASQLDRDLIALFARYKPDPSDVPAIEAIQI